MRTEPIRAGDLESPSVGLRERLAEALRFARRGPGANRFARFVLILAAYSLELVAAFHLAYDLRWDFSVPAELQQQRSLLIAAVVACKLVLLHSFGQFRSVLSYFGLADFGAVLLSMSTVSGTMLLLWFASEASAAPSRGVVLIDFVLSVALVSGSRLALRVLRSRTRSALPGETSPRRRVAIVGAGDVGEALAKDLLQRPGSGLMPVCFIDDVGENTGRSIHGLPVLGPLGALPELAGRMRVNELVIAIQDAPPRMVKEIVEAGRRIGAGTRIVPSFTELASGRVKVERSRPVAIEDLLGREQVRLDSDGIGRLLRDKVVMVTGAGGSIGAELCRQVLNHAPRRLVMIDRSEIALFEIEQELLASADESRLAPRIVDVGDETAVRQAIERFRPAIVFHAAAHKHVPLMERQPAAALGNNTLATAGLARVASEAGVGTFVFISTDKAINPTSVMGCSKRLAEKAVQARQCAPGNATAFLAVRFGNVLGSSGSVVPTFRRQIAQGGPVTVTHAEMTRYFMTIPEAVGLVLQTATIGRGGEIFILDMGRPVKILDLARQMIELSGFRPGVDIDIRITGLRPGEKLYEELRHSEETHEPTAHPRIFRLRGGGASGDASSWLNELRAAMDGPPESIKAHMQRLVPEYRPFNPAEIAGEPAAGSGKSGGKRVAVVS